jgi:FkbM family methyltransferase
MNIIQKLIKLREDGLFTIIRRRYLWYLSMLQVNNLFVGWLVEIFGNKVRMDGMSFSTDCPHITTRHKSTLAFGLHEMEERMLVSRWLPADLPLIELGGGLGVVSCLANRKLNDSFKMVVIEANREMIPVLIANRDINNCHFTIVNSALAYDVSETGFAIDREFVGSSLMGLKAGVSERVSVSATTVARVMNEFGFDQFGIICDIEGAESELIIRELPALGERVRYLMVEMHPKILSTSVVQSLLSQLSVLGFKQRQSLEDSIFCSRD